MPCLNRSGPYGDHGQQANRLEEWFVKDRCIKLFDLCHSHIKPKTGLHVISVAVLYGLISPGSVSAEDWYVDNAIALSGNGTSWASAWKSFGNINWGSIHGGDTIYISGGTSSRIYNGTLVIGASGTEGNPITITRGVEAGHDGTPILDGQNGGSNWYGVDNGWNATPRNYIVISRLRIQNYANAGLHARGVTAGVAYENNDIMTGTVSTDSPRGIDIRNSSGVTVKGNRINTPQFTKGQTDGIWSSGNDGVLFENNTVIISNTNTYGHSDALQSYQDINIAIRNNFFSQSGGADNHGLWVQDTVAGGTVSVYNNILTMPSNEACGISHWNQRYPTYNGRALLYNNTIYGANPGIQVRHSPNSEIKNNIVVVSGLLNWGTIYLYGNVPTSSMIDNNLLWPVNGAPLAKINDVVKSWSQWQATGRDTHGLNADPRFTNSMAQDFTVQANSPAIDNGATVTIVNTDKNGTLRPQGNAYDTGAYEVSQAVAPNPVGALRNNAR